MRLALGTVAETSAVLELALDTDRIVALPTETEADFASSIARSFDATIPPILSAAAPVSCCRRMDVLR